LLDRKANHPTLSRARLGSLHHVQRSLLALLAALALLAPVPVEAQTPELTPEELDCQNATFNAGITYARQAFGARQDCLLEVMKGTLLPETDCFAAVEGGGTGDPITDGALDAAQRAVAVAITSPCIGLDLANLGFPGFCPNTIEGDYTLLDHELCIVGGTDTVVDKLLRIEHPWPIELPVLPLVDRGCSDTIGRKAARMFYNEADVRTDCQQQQLEGTLSLAVDCRREEERLAPGTGDATTDANILPPHNEVLRGIADSCAQTDLTDLGFPFSCSIPIGSEFSNADLVECMYVTHHDELIRYIDILTPSTTQCGNAAIEFTEDCDDGDNFWQIGEYCRANCDALDVCGDITGDGRVTATDSLFVLQSAVGLQVCSVLVCDINGDGQISATDALMVLQTAVGISVALNCPPPPPLTCGDSVIDREEDCDDGDTSWIVGQFCNGSCAHLTCGDPNDSKSITAQDARFMLLVAIGIEACDLEVCDVDTNGTISSNDVQKVLIRATGRDVALLCPGNINP
jgi:hypothetical protein